MEAEKTGKLIAILRKEKGYTQQQLADEINVSNKTISKWENGEGFPDIANLPVLAEKLQITIDELIRGERDKVQTPASDTHEEKKITKREIVIGFLQIALVYAIIMGVAVFFETIAVEKGKYIYSDIHTFLLWITTAGIIVKLIFRVKKRYK